MNRDEKLVRPEGLPPARRDIGGHGVIYPSELSGGTWIAMNHSGASLALINWYSVAQRVKINALSRGGVIPSVSTATAANDVGAGLNDLPLDRINPFRLVTVFPGSRDIIEWRWDLKQLVHLHHPWGMRQWVSSSFDEPRAQKVRGKTFERAQSQKSAGSLVWLRRLHRSHSPQTGPFSTCMHREDAVTVSYTEVCVCRDRARMEYVHGAPCNSFEVSRVAKNGFSNGLFNRLETYPVAVIRRG